MRIKFILSTVLIIIALCFIGLLIFYQIAKMQRERTALFPPTPTKEERERAKTLPREDCGCWDNRNKICLPTADCI